VFRQTLESHASGTALVLPALLTRDDWLARLHEALPGAPTRLTRFEREILMERGARAAATRGWFPRAPFELRPGLVSEMLALYDELRRRERTVRRFCGVLFDELRVERGTDRGSESLIHQTCFLTFAFLAYERGVAGSGSLDEHALRDRLLATDPPLPFNHLVVSVADHPADPRGLWPADFDLLGRLTGLAALDVVVTDETHDAGFRERLEQELPGIEEVGVEEAGLSSPATGARQAARRRDGCGLFRAPGSRGRASRGRPPHPRASGGDWIPPRGAHGHRLPAAAAVSVSGQAGACRGARAVSGV
jgi:hypothetical protein